ncbi:hypothetical protein [Atrimonas thermophila]|uniref:hypothetical protein n=1 Tax=Atrimonas thermophila TaxID=3064161 RepID=UPI00399C96B4
MRINYKQIEKWLEEKGFEVYYDHYAKGHSAKPITAISPGGKRYKNWYWIKRTLYTSHRRLLRELQKDGYDVSELFQGTKGQA